MTRTILLLLLAGAGLLMGQEAGACGDKFLVVGRGVRQQRMQGAVQRASILLFHDPQGHLQTALRESNLKENLKLAGHRLDAAEGLAELKQRLETGKYDIVLADISEMAALEQEISSSLAKPFLLPVIYNPSGEELAEARTEFSCVMRSPSTRKHYLAVIDDAMVLRRKRSKP